MLTPKLLALHDEAVNALDFDKASEQKAVAERIAQHFSAVRAQSDRLINALETGNRLAIAAVLADEEFNRNRAFSEMRVAVREAMKAIEHNAIVAGLQAEGYIAPDPVERTLPGKIQLAETLADAGLVTPEDFKAAIEAEPITVPRSHHKKVETKKDHGGKKK